MKKLFAILWEILDDKWTEHKLELENGVDKVEGQSLIIQSRNMIDCQSFSWNIQAFGKIRHINYLMYTIRKRIGYVIRSIRVTGDGINKKNFLMESQ